LYLVAGRPKANDPPLDPKVGDDVEAKRGGH
jgi:hypothetical protein